MWTEEAPLQNEQAELLSNSDSPLNIVPALSEVQGDEIQFQAESIDVVCSMRLSNRR
jgi:hypothetical protein